MLYPKLSNRNSSFTLVFPTKQKSLEFIVTFQNSKGAFHLYGSVHAILYSCIAYDVFVGFLSLDDKVL